MLINYRFSEHFDGIISSYLHIHRKTVLECMCLKEVWSKYILEGRHTCRYYGQANDI